MSTKFVLIAAIKDCFYVGGKPPEKGSVNGYFFAVNNRRGVLLVTTYLHYRKKRRQRLEEEYVAGYPVERTLSPENNVNACKSLLWMKDKYEQYREQTDHK